MERITQILIFGFLCLTASGCFEIIEEVNMNADGSGFARLTVNLSQSKLQIKSILLLNKINGYMVPSREEMQQELNRLEHATRSIPGISNVQTDWDFDNFIFSLSGAFDRVETLNTAINEVGVSMNRTPYPVVRVRNFAYKEGEFERYHKYVVDMEQYHQIKARDRAILNGSKYITIYRFPVPITAWSHKDAIVSKNKQAIMLKTRMKALIRQKHTLANRIILK